MKKQYRISIGVLAMIAVGCGGGGSYHFTPPSVTGTVAAPVVPTVFTPPTGDTHTSTVTDPITGTKTTVFTVKPTEPPVTISNYPLPAGTVDSNGNPVTQADIVVPTGTTLKQGSPVALISDTFPIPLSVDTSVSNLVKTPKAGSPGDILLRQADGTFAQSGFSLTAGKITLNGAPINNNKLIVIQALGTGSLGVRVLGPMRIQNSDFSEQLRISGNTNIYWNVFRPSLYPTRTGYILPANGGVLTGSNLSFLFAGTKDSYVPLTGTGTLTVDISDTVTKQQNASPIHYRGVFDTLEFQDPGTDSADAIPPNGINSLTISLNLK